MDKIISSKQMSYIAMFEEKSGDDITLLIEALKEIIESHVLELLNLRSTVYEKQGLLSRALEDAMRMTQYVPTSALEYLKIGSIQSLNGKAGLAAEYYKQGPSLVSKSHSQYHQIQEANEKALIRSQSRSDIIGNLPLELVHKILGLLENPEECL